MAESEVTWKGFKLEGFRCECGQEMLNPWDVEKIRKILNERVKARKVAHSLVVTLPRSLAQMAKIKAGDSLRWMAEKGHLVLQKN